MGIAVRVTRVDLTAAELRAASARCMDGAQVRRIPAVALVLEGRPRSEAAALNGMDRQTLCDWVHRYNAVGTEGLKSRKSPGRAPFLSGAEGGVAGVGDPGTDPAMHRSCVGGARICGRKWPAAGRSRCMRARLAPGLRELGLTRLQPRPVHPKKDAEAEMAFKKTSPAWCVRRLLGTTAGRPIELWFQDEAGSASRAATPISGHQSARGHLMVRDNRQT